MQNTWIKICGITRASDASAAAKFGADAIGVVLYPESSRAVEVDAVDEIVRGLPSSVTVVALFVDPQPSLVQRALDTACVDLLQFHGSESAEFCEQFSAPYMKAVPVEASTDLETALAPYETAQYLLLDSYDPVLPGGTGKTFNWEKLDALSEVQRNRFVLAGGLAAENVAAAIEIARPFGVDVSSGVESSKGIKDHERMRTFIEGVRVSGKA